MVRDSSAAGLLRLIVAAIVVLALAIVSRRAGADETLLLEVVVNGYSTGKIGEFVMRDGALHARPEELRDLGIRVPSRSQSR